MMKYTNLIVSMGILIAVTILYYLTYDQMDTPAPKLRHTEDLLVERRPSADMTHNKKDYNTSITLHGLKIDELQQESVKGSIMDYLPNYKNPCWFQDVESAEGICCLPYFYQIGVGKSGTSQLCNVLARHPDIFKPPHKELAFWFKHFEKRGSISQYLAMLQATSRNIYNSVDRRGFHKKITFDGTPGYFADLSHPFSIPGNQDGDEPIYTLAHTLYTLNPKTKFIITMRNPTDRFFSHYHFSNKESFSVKRFHKYATVAVVLIKHCLTDHSLRSCAFNKSLVDEIKQGHKIKLTLSMYYIFVKEWLSVFPRDQIMFIKAEEFYNNPARVAKEAFKFLELDPAPRSLLNEIENKESSYQKRQEIAHHEDSYSIGMLNSTRVMLDNFFEPYNRLLADLLQDEKFLFKD